MELLKCEFGQGLTRNAFSVADSASRAACDTSLDAIVIVMDAQISRRAGVTLKVILQYRARERGEPRVRADRRRGFAAARCKGSRQPDEYR